MDILSPEFDILINEFIFADENYEYSKLNIIDEETNGNLLALSHGRNLKIYDITSNKCVRSFTSDYEISDITIINNKMIGIGNTKGELLIYE